MVNHLLISVLIIISLSACHQSEFTPTGSLELKIDAAQIQSSETLGRILFYDNSLSVNNSVACASCHKQSFAFSDPRPRSRGFAGQLGERNSMAIQNLQANFFFRSDLAFTNGLIFPGNFNLLFWDGRASHLPSMVLEPVANHQEMGIPTVSELVRRVEEKDYYRIGFKNVFGSDTINTDMIGASLAAFLISLKSQNSKFDKHLRGEANLTALELQGRQLFSDKYECESCHSLVSLGGYNFFEPMANIGLELSVNDQGMGSITGQIGDMGRFKIPNLRNATVTAPYMHDGRFQTLEEVIEHYSTGIQPHQNLDHRLRNADGTPKTFQITAAERKALIAFIHTFTDTEFLTNPTLSDPFNRSN